jgi:type IV secretory pathway VirB3-like protein
MKFAKAVLPNITIALNLAMAVVVYLDMRNPMMGFMSGPAFWGLYILTFAASVATAVVLYKWWRTPKKRPKEKKESVNSTKNIEVALDI